jgi:hypothetical protein
MYKRLKACILAINTEITMFRTILLHSSFFLYTVYSGTRCRLPFSISNLSPCVGYMFLKPQHISVIQDHLQGRIILKGNFTRIY